MRIFQILRKNYIEDFFLRLLQSLFINFTNFQSRSIIYCVMPHSDGILLITEGVSIQLFCDRHILRLIRYIVF